jgi:hypothetical protein
MTFSGTMMHGDDTIAHILKCKIQLSAMIDIYNNGNYNEKFINQRMWDIHKAFFDYTDNIINNKLLQKPGHIRRNIIAARMHCTARCVIVPIDEAVDPDQIFVPWRVGVTALQLEVINVLMNRKNYTMPDAKIKVDKAMYAYDPEIDEILKTLISECRYKSGLPVLMGRNPSLRHGAIFLLFVKKIKTSFDDNTISISPLLAPAPNFKFIERYSGNTVMHTSVNCWKPLKPVCYNAGCKARRDRVERQKEVTGSHMLKQKPCITRC